MQKKYHSCDPIELPSLNEFEEFKVVNFKVKEIETDASEENSGEKFRKNSKGINSVNLLDVNSNNPLDDVPFSPTFPGYSRPESPSPPYQPSSSSYSPIEPNYDDTELPTFVCDVQTSSLEEEYVDLTGECYWKMLNL